MNYGYILYFRDFSKYQGMGRRYDSAQGAIDAARKCVQDVQRSQPQQICEWHVIRLSDGVVIAEYGRSYPVAPPIFKMLRLFEFSNRNLVWALEQHDYVAIEAAKRLVYASAEAIANYSNL